MIRPWLALTEHWWIVVFLTANGSILCQSAWNSTNCGGSAPTLDRILVDACTAYEPDEYIIFHTGSTSLTIRNGTPSIQVNVTSNPYVSDQWASNSAAIADMNLRAGCGRALFIDPFAPPYNGIIPPYSNVMAFVKRDPGFTGSLSGLCGEGAVFVLFGNFSDGFSSSMFGNSCSGCTRNIDIQLESCSYDITYEPERLSGGNGAYIRRNGSSVYYDNAANCRPEFHQFPATPAPILNRESVTICENYSSVPEGFTVTNGNSQTAWYIDPDGSPVHYGITYVPARDLFPTPTDGMAEERNLYVANIRGGRPSTMAEISLISLPAPDADGIKLACSPSQNCTICEGENVLLRVDLSGTNGQTLKINLTEGNSNYQLELDGDGVHPFELPAADQYRILNVSNEFGCTISNGFKNTEVSIDIRSPATDYLPALPDLCNEDDPYILPQTPGGLPGIWKLTGQSVTSVDPDQLGVGTFTLNFQPSDGCAETESTDLKILPVPITGFDLPPMNCIDEYYQPVKDLSTSSGGTWTIDPAVGIDPASGAVKFSDLVQGQSYTWTYTVSSQCTNSSSKSTVVPDCPCEIEFVYETYCNDNGSPTNPLDDVFEFQLIVTGTNTSGQWTFSDDQWSGQYGDTTSLGPFPIIDGPINLSIQDSEDPSCQTTFEVDPPESCSDDCSIEVEITTVTCVDQGSPTDPEDDVFEFQLIVTGTNTSGQWTSSDDQWSGQYGDTTSVGPFPISDGPINLSIQDSEDPSCQTTFEVDPPETCSDDCSIEVEITTVTCVDQGSPTVPADDVFEFQLIVTGTNTSGQWTSSDDQWSGQYGDTTILGPFPISYGPVNLFIQDSEDPGCLTTFAVDPPETCSDDCFIEAEIIGVTCDNLGSPTDPADDVFEVELMVTGANISGQWISNDDQWSGQNGDATSLGSFPISDGPVNLSIQDSEDPGCKTTFEVDPPETCSDDCSIEVEITTVTCVDQGSPTVPADDVFEFELMVTGTNISGQWTSSDDQWSGQYGVATSLGPFPISDGPVNLSIQDSENPGCLTTFEVDPPESCSDDCSIETNITDIECDDYGTPVDSTDDIFFVEIEVLGQNVSTHWISEENDTGTYGASNLWGPYRVDGGNRSIDIQDAHDSNCHAVLEIPETPHCSTACNFNIHVSDSCVWDEDSGDQNYYFIHDNLSDDKQLYEIYYEGSLIDILPGTGDLPIGPFHAVDTGNILTFIPDRSPYCEKNIRITLPNGCRKPQPDTCLLHATMLEWDPCKVEETLNGPAPSLISEISSNLFPVKVYVNGVMASSVDHPGKHSIPVPQRWMDADDSVQVRFVHPNGCQTFLTIPGSCNENVVYLPNAFSPNQDGINDYWEISLPVNSTQIDLKIYDRWGNLITHITDPAVGLDPITWDGTSNSKKIEGGVVVYEISWIRQKKQYHRWGEILILR